jgi:hypothetical protein
MVFIDFLLAFTAILAALRGQRVDERRKAYECRSNGDGAEQLDSSQSVFFLTAKNMLLLEFSAKLVFVKN